MQELYKKLGPPSTVDADKVRPAVRALLDEHGAGLADIEEYAGAATWWTALSASYICRCR